MTPRSPIHAMLLASLEVTPIPGASPSFRRADAGPAVDASPVPPGRSYDDDLLAAFIEDDIVRPVDETVLRWARSW